MEAKITFLGTSQAIPTITRNHTSIHLNYKEENILIDCGEGTQRQLRIAKINPCKITRLLITHWHGDHVLGIPGLLQTLAMNNYSKTLYVYGPRGTIKYFNEIKRIFIPLKSIKIDIKEVNEEVFENNDITITSLPLEHGTPVNGYSVKIKDKLRIDKTKLNKSKLPSTEIIKDLVEGKDITFNKKKYKSKDLTYMELGKKISFIFDTRLCTNVKKLAKDSNLAIIESTYSADEEELAKEYFHMTSSQAALVAKETKVKQLILTHISQRYEFKDKLLYEEVKNIFKNTIIAKDLMVINI